MKTPPNEIYGNSVWLRRMRLSDAEELYHIVKHPKVARWTHLPRPYPADGTVKYIRLMQRRWRAGRTYFYGIREVDSDALVGGLDLRNVDRTHRCASLGYCLGPRWWNKGYATEAARLILDVAFERMKLHRIYTLVFARNPASVRVLEKNGFIREGRWREALVHRGRREDLLQFALLQPDYKKRITRRAKSKW